MRVKDKDLKENIYKKLEENKNTIYLNLVLVTCIAEAYVALSLPEIVSIFICTNGQGPTKSKICQQHILHHYKVNL